MHENTSELLRCFSPQFSKKECRAFYQVRRICIVLSPKFIYIFFKNIRQYCVTVFRKLGLISFNITPFWVNNALFNNRTSKLNNLQLLIVFSYLKLFSCLLNTPVCQFLLTIKFCLYLKIKWIQTFINTLFISVCRKFLLTSNCGHFNTLHSNLHCIYLLAYILIIHEHTIFNYIF